MPACPGLQDHLLGSIGFAEAPEGQGFLWGRWNRRPNPPLPQPASKLESEKQSQREGGPGLQVDSCQKGAPPGRQGQRRNGGEDWDKDCAAWGPLGRSLSGRWAGGEVEKDTGLLSKKITSCPHWRARRQLSEPGDAEQDGRGLACHLGCRTWSDGQEIPNELVKMDLGFTPSWVGSHVVTRGLSLVPDLWIASLRSKLAYFLLEYSWFTLLCWFQVYSKANHLHIYVSSENFFQVG